MTVLGTRGSDLALWQARHVQGLLRREAGLKVEIEVIRTTGDRSPEASLAAVPGKGFFTREIEEALLRGEIDLAVHSHKDLPTESPPGLVLAAIPERGPATECLLVHPEAWDPTCAETMPADGSGLDAEGSAGHGSLVVPLRRGATVGTGSARRRAQLLAARPDLEIRELRGNVPTRVARVTEHRYDAIVLAEAGLQRLGLDPAPLRVLRYQADGFVPAPAQGALAVQMRAGERGRPGDEELAAALGQMHHEPTARLVAAERLLLAAIEGGCNLPLGAYATAEGNLIKLVAVLGVDRSGVAANLQAGEFELLRCEVHGDNPAAVAEAGHAALVQ